MLPGKMLLWHFKVKSFVKIGTIPAEKLFGRTNVTDTWNLLKIIPETQVLKFGQNCDRNRSDKTKVKSVQLGKTLPFVKFVVEWGWLEGGLWIVVH